MKESASFSGNEIERTSLNFSELLGKGLKYVQELSGEVWTDYNSHDPGVTILEQLCYALTDIAFRTSTPIEDLLTPGKGLPVNAKNNAFFSPSAIFSSHPVTTNDTRKMIIDQFEEIQNIWITTKEDLGYQEELKGINRIEILPKLNFLNSLKSDPGKKESFLNQVNYFLSENRNLGENFEDACLLEQQVIEIDFEIHMNEQADVEETVANLFLKLFEFVYCPVQYYSLNEMAEAGLSVEEIFSGPLLTRGFLKNDIPDKRLKSIHIDVLQKLFSKVEGINKCVVRRIIYAGKNYASLEVEKEKFFHLLVDSGSGNMTDNRFESLYSNMNVFINDKKLPFPNKQSINNLFLEIWSKKHRGYSLGQSQDDFFHQKLIGTYRRPNDYYSIQRHFPIIYGIGEEGLSKNEPAERQAKALQLKAYLMLFEQHMANHLAQLGNLNEFFNIDFGNGQGKTYFTQRMSSIPGIDKLVTINASSVKSDTEPDSVFFDRKNRIYNHLLARFGEDLNDLPWRVSLRLNLIQNVAEFNRILLHEKSEFLIQLEKLSYNRMKGESFHPKNNKKNSRIPSGLEQIILAKTGIPPRGKKSLIPDFEGFRTHLFKYKEEDLKTQQELNTRYRPLHSEEINKFTQNSKTDIPDAVFGKIGLKALFKETLNYKNYLISIPKSPSDNVQVIFQKAPNTWVNLFACSDDDEAARNICKIINYFTDKNIQSEGIYIVDHILLSDFLEDSKYGFCFLDEYGIALFQTIEEESWGPTEDDRNAYLAKFYEYGEVADSYSSVNGNWMIKDNDGNILVSYETNNTNQQLPKEQLYKQTQNLIQLFNGSPETTGRLRFGEMEKIRLGGIMNIKRQRRLVFRRKLNSGEIIDEDFFNLNISVVLPDWPARFQDERFKDYVTNLIYERTPAHISTEIVWVNAHTFKIFEQKYHTWERLKSEQTNPNPASESLKTAAFEVYQSIKELNKNKAK